MTLTLEDFVDDTPWVPGTDTFSTVSIPDPIDGVRIQRLVGNRDSRGELTVLLTSLKDAAWPDKSRLPYGHPGIPYAFR